MGSAGNDTLIALAGEDYLFSTDSVARGAGEKDYLAGGAGGDLFFLGDADGVFYGAQGWNDFAWISDFEVGIDQLLVPGSASDYNILKRENETWIARSSDGEVIAGLANSPDISSASFFYL